MSQISIKVDELHKPRIRSQTQPVTDALPRRYAPNFESGIGLPLHHCYIAILVVFPNGARGSSGLGDDTIDDAGLRVQYGAIQDGGIEVCKLECDAIWLHGPWDCRRNGKGWKCAEDRGRGAPVLLGLRGPAALGIGIHVECHNVWNGERGSWDEGEVV